MPAPQGYGYLQPNDSRGGYNPTAFIVQQALGRVRTLLLARVVGVGSGTVDVQPLVSMVDSQGNATEHGVIFGCPFLELRAGSSAILAIPVVGDVGLIAVCDRDSSSAIASLAPGPPPSAREHDLSDAIYVLGLALGAAPTKTISIDENGVSLSAFGNNLMIGSGGISITGSSVTINGIDFSTHVHSGVTTGGGTSGPPV